MQDTNYDMFFSHMPYSHYKLPLLREVIDLLVPARNEPDFFPVGARQSAMFDYPSGKNPKKDILLIIYVGSRSLVPEKDSYHPNKPVIEHEEMLHNFSLSSASNPSDPLPSRDDFLRKASTDNADILRNEYNVSDGFVFRSYVHGTFLKERMPFLYAAAAANLNTVVLQDFTILGLLFFFHCLYYDTQLQCSKLVRYLGVSGAASLIPVSVALHLGKEMELINIIRHALPPHKQSRLGLYIVLLNTMRSESGLSPQHVKTLFPIELAYVPLDRTFLNSIPTKILKPFDKFLDSLVRRWTWPKNDTSSIETKKRIMDSTIMLAITNALSKHRRNAQVGLSEIRDAAGVSSKTTAPKTYREILYTEEFTNSIELITLNQASFLIRARSADPAIDINNNNNNNNNNNKSIVDTENYSELPVVSGKSFTNFYRNEEETRFFFAYVQVAFLMQQDIPDVDPASQSGNLFPPIKSVRENWQRLQNEAKQWDVAASRISKLINEELVWNEDVWGDDGKHRTANQEKALVTTNGGPGRLANDKAQRKLNSLVCQDFHPSQRIKWPLLYVVDDGPWIRVSAADLKEEYLNKFSVGERTGERQRLASANFSSNKERAMVRGGQKALRALRVANKNFPNPISIVKEYLFQVNQISRNVSNGTLFAAAYGLLDYLPYSVRPTDGKMLKAFQNERILIWGTDIVSPLFEKKFVLNFTVVINYHRKSSSSGAMQRVDVTRKKRYPPPQPRLSSSDIPPYTAFNHRELIYTEDQKNTKIVAMVVTFQKPPSTLYNTLAQLITPQYPLNLVSTNRLYIEELHLHSFGSIYLYEIVPVEYPPGSGQVYYDVVQVKWIRTNGIDSGLLGGLLGGFGGFALGYGLTGSPLVGVGAGLLGGFAGYGIGRAIDRDRSSAAFSAAAGSLVERRDGDFNTAAGDIDQKSPGFTTTVIYINQAHAQNGATGAVAGALIGGGAGLLLSRGDPLVGLGGAAAGGLIGYSLGQTSSNGNDTNSGTTGAIGGALIGGGAGLLLSKGDPLVGLGGAAAGGLIGYSLGRTSGGNGKNDDKENQPVATIVDPYRINLLQ